MTSISSTRFTKSVLNIIYSNIIKSAYLILSAFFISSYSMAQTSQDNDFDKPEQWYQIEYIIFEHLQTDDHILRYEDTPYPKKLDKQYTYVVQNKQPASAYQYSQLSQEEMMLANAFQRLKKSRAVKVLDMAAWQQPLSTDRTSPPIKIKQNVSEERLLFGELQLKKSRYTHAEFKLYLAKVVKVPFKNIKHWLVEQHTNWQITDLLTPIDTPLFTSAIGESEIYQNIRYLGESRRIKESEVHYIDHPVISAIITIKEVASPFEYLSNPSFSEQNDAR